MHQIHFIAQGLWSLSAVKSSTDCSLHFGLLIISIPSNMQINATGMNKMHKHPIIFSYSFPWRSKQTQCRLWVILFYLPLHSRLYFSSLFLPDPITWRAKQMWLFFWVIISFAKGSDGVVWFGLMAYQPL